VKDKMAAALPAPVRVSPFIKLCRYSALGLGIFWGASRHRSISKKELAYREYESKQKVIRDARNAEEKKRLNKEELLYLARETGTPVPADFHTKF